MRSVQDLATRILVQPTRKPNLVKTTPDFLVTGREALWAEQSGPQNLGPTVWPPAASIAEIFWLDETLSDGLGGGKRSTEGGDEALLRLHGANCWMRQRGVDRIDLQGVLSATL